MNFILASNSPRRKEILSALGLSFSVVTASQTEKVNELLSAALNCQQIALQKALAVVHNVPDSSVIIASDTIVWQEGIFLGKPQNKQHAQEMLQRLSGKAHKVYSGLTLVEVPSQKISLTFEETTVHFKELTTRQIATYVNKGESFDKAGGYGVQGLGQSLIEKIEGSFYNVMGFLVHEFLKLVSPFALGLDMQLLEEKIPSPFYTS